MVSKVNSSKVDFVQSEGRLKRGIAVLLQKDIQIRLHFNSPNATSEILISRGQSKLYDLSEIEKLFTYSSLQ